MHNREQLLHRLIDVVGAYGADRRRWPAADQQALRALLESDPEAKQLLCEAALMDQLLDAADQVEAPSGHAMDRLADRIMANLDTDFASGRPVADKGTRAETAEVIAFPGSLRGDTSPADEHSGHEQGSSADGQVHDVPQWAIRAALAASLMLGIFVGAAGYLEETAHRVTILAGLDVSFGVAVDTSLSTGALIDDAFSMPEEEFL